MKWALGISFGLHLALIVSVVLFWALLPAFRHIDDMSQVR